MLGQIDFAHAALAELGLEAILSEFFCLEGLFRKGVHAAGREDGNGPSHAELPNQRQQRRWLVLRLHGAIVSTMANAEMPSATTADRCQDAGIRTP